MRLFITLITFKKWYSVIIMMCIVVMFFLFWKCAFMLNKQRYESMDCVCYSKLYCIRDRIQSLYWATNNCYFSTNHFPLFADKNGGEQWSWRLCFLLNEKNNSKETFDPQQNFASESDKLYYIHDFPSWNSLFTCQFKGKTDLSSFVAVKGKGTLWTLREHNVNVPDEVTKQMIILLETPFPSKKWYEPGDDISPEEVIRLYIAYKDGTLSIRNKSIYYATLNTVGNFDEIPNIEELKKKLVYTPEQ